MSARRPRPRGAGRPRGSDWALQGRTLTNLVGPSVGWAPRHAEQLTAPEPRLLVSAPDCPVREGVRRRQVRWDLIVRWGDGDKDAETLLFNLFDADDARLAARGATEVGGVSNAAFRQMVTGLARDMALERLRAARRRRT